MYGTGIKYLFELTNKIFYTGVVIQEDKTNILVKTKMNEELILSKREIIQARVVQ